MNNRKNLTSLLILASLTGLLACSPATSAPAASADRTPAELRQGPETTAPAVPPAPVHNPVPADRDASRLLVVHKHPSCGCCGLWIEHMREAGFQVQVQDHEDMGPIKGRVGVPYAKGSCHTAEIDGYFIEGHVPAADVRRLLAERPDARGLTVPGMPAGSPGMELPDGTVHPYAVELVAQDGSTTEYARHGD